MLNRERNGGIDLLRLVLMYMVCMLHTLQQGGILGEISEGTNRGGDSIYLLINTFSYCAVDGFAIISGYMANNRPRKWSRLVEMWFQAFFYSFVITLILVFAGIGSGLRIMGVIRCALPVTSEYFWYFTAFFGLYFVIPVLDKIFVYD